MKSNADEIPRGNLAGLRANVKADVLSGFLVFLIALPLCLGIALACGYPAISGIFTAIIGGVLATFFSNSELTIKGPAAGLIVIAIGCVMEFGFTGGKDPAADYQAYRLALGVGVAAGIIQILFGVFRAGILGEFFPTAAIHGLLAAIGVIIIAKQFPIVMGLSSEGTPLELLANIPTFVMEMNPKIGLIGIVSLLIMFALIGSLESLLSAKAIDEIDPWKRKTSMDRDMLAVGIGNTLAAFVGGLPMISEIVRSKANIDNGARTRFANMFHGLFLLVFVALLPGLINQIPLAALGALLVFTGFRLASPLEFVHMYHLGKDQFIIFVSTVIAVLATDLLTGIAIGIGVKVVIHIYHGAPIPSFFKLNVEVTQQEDNTAIIVVRDSAIFSTWIPLRKHLARFLQEGKDVTLNLAETRLVDHTVMAKLNEWANEFEEQDRKLLVKGLEQHVPMSDDDVAAHVKRHA